MHQHKVSWFDSICGRIEWNAFAHRGFVCIYSSYRNWCHSCASVCIEILIKKFTFYFFQMAFNVCQLPLSLKCSHMHRTGKKSHFFYLHFKKFVDETNQCSSNVLGSHRIKFHSTSSLHTFLCLSSNLLEKFNALQKSFYSAYLQFFQQIIILTIQLSPADDPLLPRPKQTLHMVWAFCL